MTEKLIFIIQALSRQVSDEQKLMPLVEKIARDYIQYMYKQVHSRGKPDTIDLFKQINLIAKAIATNNTFEPLRWRKSDPEGVPDLLKDLLPLLKGDPSEKRIALTITRSYELLHTEPKFDPAPIVEPGDAVDSVFLEEFRLFLVQWLPKVFGRFSLPTSDKANTRLVKGPNGPSILTAHYDAAAIWADKDLSSAMIKFASLTGGNWILGWSKRIASFTKNNSYIHSRIALIPESGGKTRTIAIGDYWSQLLLKPLHNCIMAKLRRLETDGTWNQDYQSNRIVSLAQHPSYSFDLTSATDRFPLSVQKTLLSVAFGKELADSWEGIMINREFHINNTKVRWARGQPLGFYSSWATFAITHHALIEFAARKVGITSFRSYAVLGDDVVIWDTKVALKYREIMTSLSVKINESKSIYSTEGHNRIEFAKRLFYNGTEISGLKMDILKGAACHITMIPDLLRVAMLRSFDISVCDFRIPSYLSDKGKELLSVLLFEMSGGARPIEGGKAFQTTIEELRHEMAKIRIAQLEKQRDSIFVHLSGNKPIDGYFDREGISVHKQIIGLAERVDTTCLHPIVWELNKRGEMIFDLLEQLECYIDNWKTTGVMPEVAPCEYIPLLDNSVYFGDRQKLRSLMHASLALRAYFNLKTGQK